MTEEVQVLSVTEISLSIKGCIEQVFEKVSVRGEVSDLKRATSGHIYFSLKDDKSVLSAICWKGSGAVQSLLTEGLEVICTGKITTYPGRSNYQMIVQNVEPAGMGALLKLLQERKDKLEKEGLFDSARKKPIPYLPQTIGVITSPTGAVIRDIIHRITDRFPRHLIVWPVAVQGDEAPEQIVAALDGFNAFPPEGLSINGKMIPRPDVLIVARGGGSLEDLWCFNDEAVVRSVARSVIPVISAVGHETDTTLIDYASDLRAPTPTGAAEKAVPVRQELLASCDLMGVRLNQAIGHFIRQHQERLTLLSKTLPNLEDFIHLFTQRLDDLKERLTLAITHILDTQGHQLQMMIKLLESYSYKSILNRGFAFVSHQNQVVSSAAQAKNYALLQLNFKDGILDIAPVSKKNKPSKEKNDEPTLF